ncbi:hypothetical protein NQZ68_007699 [Dissostichus eleginoides]|nr:hypothetical protein NQZ68_007699 [Dissostichus eleginoides]
MAPLCALFSSGSPRASGQAKANHTGRPKREEKEVGRSGGEKGKVVLGEVEKGGGTASVIGPLLLVFGSF